MTSYWISKESINVVRYNSIEFAKLRASSAITPYMPSRLCVLRVLCAFVPLCLKAPSCLTCLMRLHALGVLLTYFTYAHCASFSRALLALFVHVKIVLGWICSPGKTYHFQRIIKDTTNCAVFKWVKKQSWNFLSGEFF